MEILKHLSDNLILVVPSNIKEEIIKEISNLDKIFCYKIYSDSELKKALYFDYSYKTINYICKTQNINYHVAKEYIQAMYFLDNKTYKYEKINKLVKIKQELIDNNLLTIDKRIKNIIKNKKVIVYGFDIINKELKQLLSQIEDYQIIKDEIKTRKTNKVFKFVTLEEEVDAICYEISKLLEKGVNINKIKLANINQDYYFTLNRYFKMYNIPLSNLYNTSLFSYRCVKDFYNQCVISNSIDESLNYFNKKYKEEKNIYNVLINICNKFVGLSFNEVSEVFKQVLIESSINEYKENVVEIIDIDNKIFKEDEYVFIPSINQGIMPKTYKNDDFLSDYEKKEINLDTSEDKNKQEKEKFKLLLCKSNNEFLSYKEKTAFSNFNKAFILNEENIIEEKYNKEFLISFSKESDKLFLAKIYDKIYQQNEDLKVAVLSNNYEIDYKTYDHRFKRFDPKKIQQFMIENHKSLSYSSINSYFECGFKYFLANILSLSKDKVIRSAQIGIVFHKILELSNKSDFDFEKTFKNELKFIDDKVTRFYLEKFKETIKDTIDINKENLKDSKLTKTLNEKKVEIKLNEPIYIKFKGFIDKILYNDENDKTYVAIIDYKTSDPDINLEKVKYGLSLQIPVYLYLLKHTNEFKNVICCGFYLQKILPPLINYENGYEKTLKEHIKLQGYSNKSFSILSLLDPHYEDSALIKSMKTLKDGNFAKSAKILSNEEMDDLAILVEQKIKEGLKDICDCKFDISPKILSGRNQSCKYCEFSDCCFVKHDDNVYLDKKEEIEEMAGEVYGD